MNVPEGMRTRVVATGLPWFGEPCPPWCPEEPGHASDWAADDRNHVGETWAILLSSMDAVHDKIGEDQHEFTMPELHCQIWQNFREREPRISVSHGDLPNEVLYLTLGEAEAFAANVLKLITIARGERSLWAA